MVPGLTGKISDIRIAVFFDQVVYKDLHRIVVIREYRREILALLVDKYDRTLAAFMDHLLDTVRQARRLQGVRHDGNSIKFLKGNKREDRRLAHFSSEIILIFEVASEDQDIGIVLKGIIDEALNELGLIVFISLRYK